MCVLSLVEFRMKIVALATLCALIASSHGRQGFGPGEQDWGYVTVRPKAHMFWWLFETTADVKNITEKPLVIWLQGGPGGDSTGFGNFGELGPLDEHLNPRNHTWVKHVNVLFIDNPVGTGFSYVDELSSLTTDNKQIADDLITLLDGFYTRRPDLKNVSLYVAAESYGGKMAVEFAIEVDKRNKNASSSHINLKGVALIDSWISPIESVLTWGPFLYHIGAVDRDGERRVNEGAHKTEEALNAGKFELATEYWADTENIIWNEAKFIDFYNVLTKIPSWSRARIIGGRKLVVPCGETSIDDDSIETLLRGPVTKALGVNVTFAAQKNDVFEALEGDFMKAVTHIVEQLLNKTDIRVQVISGQLDLIVDTPGTVHWVDRLKWTHSSNWKKTPRDALRVNGVNEGYQKKLGNLSFYWVNRAGHMVPYDNPPATEAIINDLIGVKPT